MKNRHIKGIKRIAYQVVILAIISFLAIPPTALPIFASDVEAGVVAPTSEISNAPQATVPDAVIETGGAIIEAINFNDVNINEIGNTNTPPQENTPTPETIPTPEPTPMPEVINPDSGAESNTEEPNVTTEVVAEEGADGTSEPTQSIEDPMSSDESGSIEEPLASDEEALAEESNLVDEINQSLEALGHGDTPVIDNTNDATINNTASLAGNTGSNTISSSSDKAVIKTGDVEILNIIVNYINNNFIGTGKSFIINIFNKLFQTIDLSGFDEERAPTEENQIQSHSNGGLSVNNYNTSVIDNKVVITANTGENIITESGGENIIQTGDINIANDIINIANMNIVGNDWFFAVVNIAGELNGDLILPAFKNGSSTLEVSPEAEKAIEKSSVDLLITNDNFASSSNDVKINANTGGNNSSGSNGSLISTGDVNVESHIFNLVNYNIFNNTWKYVRINIFGNWEGIIEGLPAGYSYMQDESGITIYDNYLNDYNFYASYADFIVKNENKATTTNDVEINANTGDNTIDNGSSSLIFTGDINIHNNLLNLVNMNFFGNDWEFSLINVYGDWHGDLAFGRPELWIMESVDTSAPYKIGDEITFNFIFGNNGDAPATDIMIKNTFDNNSLLSINGGNAVTLDDGSGWKIPDLAPNSQGSFSFTATVQNIPASFESIRNTATIGSAEKDRNYGNNSASETVRIAMSRYNNEPSNTDFITPGNNNLTVPLNLVIIKSNDAKGVVKTNEKVNFSISITNNDFRPLSNAVLTDIMRSAVSSREINHEVWNLDTIPPGETIVIDYTMEVKSYIDNGIYINEAVLSGLMNGYTFTKSASSRINVVNPVTDTVSILKTGTTTKPLTTILPIFSNKKVVRNNTPIYRGQIKEVLGYTDKTPLYNEQEEVEENIASSSATASIIIPTLGIVTPNAEPFPLAWYLSALTASLLILAMLKYPSFAKIVQGAITSVPLASMKLLSGFGKWMLVATSLRNKKLKAMGRKTIV